MTLTHVLHKAVMWGELCKCGAKFEDHSYCGDYCPYLPGEPLKHFTLEDRLSPDEAWEEAACRK